MNQATILLVTEDEAHTAMELRDRLQRLGYSIAGNTTEGEKALELLRTTPADLVLIDINLSGAIDGIETARRVQEWSDVPVIFVTTYSDTSLLERAGKVEPFGCLVKPFGERELHAAIQMALYKRRMERALREANTGLETAVQARTAELETLNRTLETERHRLTSTIEGTNTGTWECNVQTGEAAYNERWAGIVGYRLEELSPLSVKTWLALAHPDDLARSDEILQRHFSGELSHYDCECRMRHKDGRWVWVHARGRLVSWTEDGRPLMMYGTHTDITARKTDEADLRSSRARLDHLLTAAPVTIHSSEGRPPFHALFISANVEDLLGFPAGTFLGQPGFWTARIHPDDRDRVHAGLKTLRPGETLVHEYRFQHCDGSWRWLRDTLRVVDNPADHSPEFVGHCIDITAQKAAEEREERQRAMLADVRTVQEQFIAGSDRFHAFDQLLAAALRHTRSEYGFIGEVLLDPDGQPYLQTHAISDIAWDGETRRLLDTRRESGMRFENTGNLFGHVLTSRAPLISNDPAHDPRRGSLPTGHPALRSFAGLPIFVGSEMVGMIGLANRPEGYRLDDLGSIDPLLTAYGILILAWRQRRLRMEADDSRRESELRLRDLFENTNDLVQSTAPDGTLLLVNRAWRETLGYTEDEACRLNVFTIIHPDCQEHCAAAFGRLMQGGTIGLIDVTFVARDGRRVELEGNISVRMENGRPVSTRGIFRDVTARKQAEAALREINANLEHLVEERTGALRVSEERFRLVHQAAFNVIWDQELATEAIWWSERFHTVFGHDCIAASGNGSFWREHLHPDDRDRIVAGVSSALTGPGDVWHADYRFRRADGTYAHVEDRAYIVRDQSGRALRLLGAMQDVSDRKQAELALRESEQRYQRVVENISDALIIDDVDGQLVYANDRFLEMLGITREELSYVKLESYVAPEYREALRERHNRRIAGEAVPVHFEYVGLRRDGSRRWFEVRVSPVMEQGRIIGTQSAIRDVTDRKQVELELREAERRHRTLLGNLRGMAYRRNAGELFTLTYISEGARDLLGYEPAQVLAGKPSYRSLLDPADLARVLSEARVILTTPRAYQFEYRVRRADGAERWVWDQGCVVRDGDHLVCIEGFVTDITESKVAKQQLAASEENFRQLANASPAGIFATDANGLCQFVSARWTQITGLDLAQAQGPAWSTTLHPEDRERVIEAWAAATRSAGSFSLDYRFVNPQSGKTIWVLGQAEPVIPPGGLEVSGYIGTVTEVTEQKLIELTLRALSTELVQHSGNDYLIAAAGKLASLLDSEDAFIGLWDPTRNDQIHLVAHYHQGSQLPDQVHPLADSACAEVLRAGEAIITDDVGSLYSVGPWVRCATPHGYGAVPIKDSANRVIGLVGVASSSHWTNVDRVKSVIGLFAVSLGAELEKQRSHARFRALFEFSPDAIIMTDRSGIIRQVNQRAIELFGWAREEMVGQPVERLIPQEHRQRHTPHREKFVARAHPRRMGEAKSQLQARRKDGSVFPADISLSPIETEEGILVAAAVRDLTQQHEAEALRRRAELEIRQAQKMESLGTLAGGIAHDFNNILTGMLGFVELARMDLPNEHPARQWIEQVSASGQRAKSLVRQILAFSRKDAKRELVPTRLQSIINEALDLLRSSVPAMVRIERHVDRDSLPVMADATQIHQVVMNLGTNAWRALPDSGGVIRIELTSCTLSAEQAKELAEIPPGAALVRLSVMDNGCGMEPAVLERIFEPFFTTRPVGEGTGLGLSAVHGIVKAHDGAIRVSSTPGKGTRFDIYLPTITREAPPQEQGTAYTSGRGQKVLLVDDDEQGGEALRFMLQRAGYTVTHFRNPTEAVARFRAAPAEFDLVVTDFAMPALSGQALLEAVRAIRAEMPAVLISGNLTPANLAAIAKDPLTVTLDKPVMLAELANAVHKSLTRGRG